MRFLVIIFVLLIQLCRVDFLQAQQSWRKIGDLQFARTLFGALPISSRQILVMGGYGENGITRTCEIIDIESGSISRAASMNEARAESIFLLTRDSNIVAISGLSTINGNVSPVCELYDRRSGVWSVIGRLLTARRQHTACFLNSEEILVVGGRDENIVTLSSAEIFNIRTGQSRRVNDDFPVPINFGHAIISSLGKPIILAGRAGGANSSRTNRVFEFNMADGSWQPISSILQGVAAPAITKVFDGRIILAGGTRSENPPFFSNQIFLENYPNFQTIAPMSVERHWCGIAQWNADSVLVLGGFTNTDARLASTEWVNLRTQTISSAPPMLAAHSQFVALGMPIFNAQGQQTKARIVAISGLSNTVAVTPTVEILETDIRVPPPPPPPPPPFPEITQMVDGTDDCTVFRVILRATSGTVRNIELGVSMNIRLEVRTVLPAQTVEIFLRVQNPAQPSSLSSLRITDNLNRTEFIPVVVSFPDRISVLSVIGDVSQLFGESASTLTCATLRVRNSSSREIVVPMVNFARNIEFSSPLSQFPVCIRANSEAVLTVCYNPSILGVQRDTLSIADGCRDLRVPLQGRGATAVYNVASRCDVSVRLRTLLPSLSSGQIGTIAFAHTPFPQPLQGDIVNIPIEMMTIKHTTQPPICTVYNASGLYMGRFEIEEWSSETLQTSINKFTGIVRLNVQALVNGVYRCVFTNEEGVLSSVPMVIMR